MENSKNKVKKKATFVSKYDKTRSNTLTFFLVVLVVFFPLIIFDAYFNILYAKFITYSVITVTMLVCFTAITLSHEIRWRQHLLNDTKSKIKIFFSDKINILASIFLLVSVISTLQSDYMAQAFWGTSGRYNGLFLTALYVISFLVISHHWHFNVHILDLLLLSGFVVSLIGITDFFRLELLNIHLNVHEMDRDYYLSTIGNINTFTAFVTALCALSGTLFVLEKDVKKSAIYFLFTTAGFLAGIIGRSDSLYLALGVFFAVLPLFILHERRCLWRYFALLLTLMLGAWLLSWFSTTTPDNVIPIDTMIIAATSSLLFFPAILVVAVLTLLLFLTRNRSNILHLRSVWIGFLGLVLVVVIAVLVDANLLSGGERYGALAGSLVFNDDWGSMRGVIWRSSLEVFADFSLVRMLFGFGPDTFSLLISGTDAEQAFLANDLGLDNAHNEYLHYLLTIGILGVFAYIAFLFICLKRIAKAAKNNIYAIGCFLAALCYAVQAFVNLNLPIVTPLLWLMLSFGVAISRKERQ